MLLSDEGNVRYVAAAVRRLIEIRKEGQLGFGQISPVESLTPMDVQLIMDGYWWGVGTEFGSGGYHRREFCMATEPKHRTGPLIDCSYELYRELLSQGD